MRIYLDLCCFNRPYDDQTQSHIRLETEAKLLIQQKVRDGVCELAWSAILDFENARNPFIEHSRAILQWRALAAVCVQIDAPVLDQARRLLALGLGEYDALHVACACRAGADLFVSTDDRLIRRVQTQSEIRAMLPGDALAYLEKWYED